MKVVLVNTSERTGGAAIAANRLMKALVNNGIDAKTLVLNKQSNDERVIPIQSSFSKKIIARYNFLWERFVIFFYNRFSREKLFKVSIANTGFNISAHPLVKEANIIHLHWINQGFLSLKDIGKLIRLGKPIVWTMHDMWACTGICHYSGYCEKYTNECCNCPVLLENNPNDLAYKIFSKKKKIKLDQIHYVGCSRWISEQVKNSFLLKNATIISILNPINTKVFYPKDKIAARKQLQLPTDKHLLLFSAVKISDTRKGGIYFIDACKRICRKYSELGQTIEVVLMGKGDETFFSEIALKIHSLHYVSNDAELADVYSAADIFVIPSLEDNLPNTIMESMACGTPCVGFNVGGIPEMIDHKQNGYLAEYKSAEDLANGIRWVLTEANYAELSRNAIDKVRQTYDEAIIAGKYKDLYEEIVSKQASH